MTREGTQQRGRGYKVVGIGRDESRRDLKCNEERGDARVA